MASTLAVVAVTVTALLLVALLSSGVGILEHALKGIGLLIAFYYALAGIAVSVAYRSVLLASAGNLIFLGLWPLAGTAFNIWVFAASIPTLTGTELTIGLGLLAVGLVPLAIARIRGGRSFFHPRPLGPRSEEAADAYLPAALSDAGPDDVRRDGLLSDF